MNELILLASLLPLLIIIIIWEMVWKGIALWKAGTKKQLAWFVCIFIFNTLGILPIIYLLFFQKKETIKPKSVPVKKKTKKSTKKKK
jgi:uncharacterized membrane protein